MDIVKKYNYKPYDNFQKSEINNYQIALIIPTGSVIKNYIESYENEVINNNYTLVIFIYDSQDSLIEKIDICEAKNVSGLIVYVENNIKIDVEKINNKLPTVSVNLSYEEIKANFYLNYKNNVDISLKLLKKYNHKKVSYIFDNNFRKLNEYIKEKIYLMKLNDDINCIFNKSDIYKVLDRGNTAVIVENEVVLEKVSKYLFENNLNINNEVSIISLSNLNNDFFKSIYTHISSNHKSKIFEVVKLLVDKMEDKKIKTFTTEYDSYLNEKASVNYPEIDEQQSRILVIGSINIDIIKKVNSIPFSSDEVIIDNIDYLAGGKGANQALGIAKLGSKVAILGKVGDDSDGHLSLKNMKKYKVDLDRVEIVHDDYTGKAYITVSDEGESIIELYSGANNKINIDYIKENIIDFEDVKYCLVQTEIPTEIVNFIIKYCSENKIFSVLNLASINNIEEFNFRYVEYFIVNISRVMQINKSFKDINEHIDFFLDKGIKNVIIYDDRNKNTSISYYGSKEIKKTYKVENKNVIDKTGATDSFISAFTVCLNRGKTIEESIFIGMYSAVLNKSKYGAQNSMPNLRELNKYMEERGGDKCPLLL